MVFKYREFSMVARTSFYSNFESTCSSMEPVPAIVETAYAMGAFAFIKELKTGLFVDDDPDSRNVDTVGFDDISTKAMEEALDGLKVYPVRFSIIAMLAKIAKDIKTYYGLYNDEEEE